jgi:hypothetical protein
VAQPQPRREFPSALEFARIAHRRHHRGSHQRTHSFDLGEPLTALVLLKHSLDSVIVGANPFVEEAQPLGDLLQGFAEQLTQAVTLGIGENLQ